MSFINKTNIQYSITELNAELDKLIQEHVFVKDKNRTSSYPSIINITQDSKGMIIGKAININERFKDTIFEEIFKKHSPLSNLQIRLLDTEGTYVAHKDIDTRSHIAIKTNPYCIITNFETYESTHIPSDGFVYELNARCVHSAINCGDTPRYHLLWSHYKCINITEIPYIVTINISNVPVLKWQQNYLVNLIIKYENHIQEVNIKNTSNDFFERTYYISFTDSVFGKEFLNELNKLIKTNLTPAKVVIYETP